MNKLFSVIVSALMLSYDFCYAQITPQNDTLFFQQAELFEKLGIPEAWKITRGNPEIVIGCIDNGFDFYHPYLHGQLIPGYYADGVYHPMTFQTMAHGTLVSSIMVAKSQNKNGMHGLAPDCKVLTASIGSMEHILRRRQEIMTNNPDMSMPDVMKEVYKDTLVVQQFTSQWMDYVATATAESIIYLVKKGVKVINMSMEIVGISPTHNQQKINNALDYARTHDVLVIIAAGNSNREIPNTLNNRDNIIMVGACTQNDTRWTVTTGTITQGSNWGELLDVCAPVENLVVCQPSDSRFYKADDSPFGVENIPYTGTICDVMPIGATSAATPIVTSLAALVYSIDPGMSATAVKKAILESCDDIGEEGIDPFTGHGRINFEKTLSLISDRKEE